MNNSLIITYNNKLNTYYNSILNMKYLFEISKCCGYSEIISVYKEHSTLQDLYNNVLCQFQMNSLQNLWIINSVTGEKLSIPNNNTPLQQYISSNNAFLTPIYPLPAKVVYRVYFDDGACHSNQHNNNNNNISLPCNIHC
jgi:hypothetical protein